MEHEARQAFTEKRASHLEDTLAGIHFKALAARTTQIARHYDEQNEDTKRFADGWRQGTTIVDRYELYQTWFINIFSELQQLRDGCLRYISTAEHQIEFFEPYTRPVHFTTYLGGPKDRDLEKDGRSKTLNENITEPGQAEWASPIVFATEKNGTLLYCADKRKLDAVTK